MMPDAETGKNLTLPVGESESNLRLVNNMQSQEQKRLSQTVLDVVVLEALVTALSLLQLKSNSAES